MASKYKVAHIREQGVDLIIVPLESNFHNKTSSDQNSFIAEFQRCTNIARLAGTVVPVWVYGNRFYFISPPNYQSFFKSINMQYVMANINKEVTCD